MPTREEFADPGWPEAVRSVYSEIRKRTFLERYGWAILAALLAAAFRIALNPLLGGTITFATFFPAVIVAAWIGGVGPGLLVLALGGITNAFLLEPVGYLALHDLADLSNLILYLAMGLVLIGLVHIQQKARRSAFEAIADLHASEARFRQIAENINEVLWMSTPDRMRMLYVSPRFEALYGRSVASLYARPEMLVEATHPEDRARMLAAWPTRARGEYSEEYRIIRPDGATRWVLEHAVPIRDRAGRVLRIAGITEDITERKQAEDRLKEEARRKDDFLAMLGHELRNPLAPIRTSVELLSRLSPPADERMRKAAEMITRQVAHMARLIDDLLDVSRISRGKILLRKEPFELVEVVRATVEDHRVALERSGLEVTTVLPDKPLWILGDQTRVAQIVENLLGNAHKFTDPGGRVRVELQSGPGQNVTLRVIDNGIGIDPKMLERIFEAFTQADRSLSRTRGGLGLGLALVKGLVEAHGGELCAHSPGLGQGTEVVVQLPLYLSAPADIRPEVQSSGRGALHRVLVIEDNVDAAESLRLLLELFGHTVEVAYNGLDGLEAARRFRPEVVLCDIGLPGNLDGYAVAQAIRHDPGLSNTYLIALTGYGAQEDQRQAAEAGFDRHMVKPVSPEQLEQVLATAPAAAGG